MYRKNKRKKRLIILFSIIICLILSSVFINMNINLPTYVFKDGFMYVNSTITHFFNRDYDSLKKENEKLRGELEIYKDYKNLNDELENEISKLKEATSISDLLSDRDYVFGSVINRDLDYWQQKLIIDIGTSKGVSKNMAVISNGSLVGVIDDASLSSSSVVLLCNHKFPLNISVKIKVGDDYVYGILNNYDESSDLFEIIGVVDNIDIPSGSLVVTSGLGNIFPSGVLIGSVSDVTTDNFDLSKVINVKSDVNFDDISYVTVVKRDQK